MKFTIEKDALLPAVAYAAGIAEKTPGVMPMLSCVGLAAVDGQLSFTATDLVNFICVSVPAEVKASSGLVLPAKKLLDIVKKLPDGEATVAVNDKFQATVKSGGSTFRLSGAAVDGFPQFPAPPALRDQDLFPAPPLRTAIQQTVYATRDDEVNLALCGVYFRENLAVATDKHRLALTSYEGPLRDVILPRKGLEELVKVLKGLDDVFIEESDGYVHFTGGDPTVILSIKKVDTSFVPYEAVIPDRQPSRFTCGSEALKLAFDRVALMSESKNNVRVIVKDATFKVVAECLDGAAEEVVDGDLEAEDVELILNAAFVMEALDRLGAEEVNVTFGDNRSPVVITPTGGGAKALIMPWG